MFNVFALGQWPSRQILPIVVQAVEHGKGGGIPLALHFDFKKSSSLMATYLPFSNSKPLTMSGHLTSFSQWLHNFCI